MRQSEVEIADFRSDTLDCVGIMFSSWFEVGRNRADTVFWIAGLWLPSSMQDSALVRVVSDAARWLIACSTVRYLVFVELRERPSPHGIPG
jgi:hypothetical protein